MKGIKGFIRRLTKVLYILSLILLVVFSLLVPMSYIPKKVLDEEKTTINCFNGRKYQIDYFTTGIITELTADGKGMKWDDRDERDAKILCHNGSKYDYTNDQVFPVDRNFEDIIPYTKIQGSWLEVIAWGGGILIIGYFFISIIKETLLYLLLGEKFTFDWIKKPIIFISKLNKNE